MNRRNGFEGRTGGRQVPRPPLKHPSQPRGSGSRGLLATSSSQPGLYIHTPFCKSKCPYCDFYSVTSTEQIAAFLETLDQEARLYREQFHFFDSLYLGGGTPSLLGEAHLAELMKNLRRHFTFAPDMEFTLEANPDDITAEKLRIFRELGVNRLSLGAQSFDEAELRFLQRRHTARQTRQALELIRAAGFSNLGLDLIYGLPGQTPAAWLHTLKTALNFAPEHLSCYQLTLADDTPMGRLAATGQVQPLDEEAQRQFFLLTARFLKEQGYIHYEVANFARAEAYVCRHNRKYWTHVPYLGLGPAAHSFHGNRRWWNHRSLKDYCAALDAGEPPVAGAETLTPAQLRLETLYLGFRTQEGVALATLQEQPRWDAVLAELTQAGLLEVHHDRVIATPQGLVVADALPLRFADENCAG